MVKRLSPFLTGLLLSSALGVTPPAIAQDLMPGESSPITLDTLADALLSGCTAKEKVTANGALLLRMDAKDGINAKITKPSDSAWSLEKTCPENGEGNRPNPLRAVAAEITAKHNGEASGSYEETNAKGQKTTASFSFQGGPLDIFSGFARGLMIWKTNDKEYRITAEGTVTSAQGTPVDPRIAERLRTTRSQANQACDSVFVGKKPKDYSFFTVKFD